MRRFPDRSRVSPVLKRIVPPTHVLVMVFATVVPLIREDWFVMVVILFSKYIGLFVSKLTTSPTENTGTRFQTMSLNAFIFMEALPGVVIVSFPGRMAPGLVDAILQLVHHAAVVSQFSYCPAAFGRSTTPFPQ